MSSASPVSYSLDDKDLDDDALWAVIDSAEASHSSSKSRKYPKFQSPSPPPPPPPRRSHFNNNSPYSDPYRRAHKIARSCESSSEVSEGTGSHLAVVRTPILKTSSYYSPESYLSPHIASEVSPVALEMEEKDAMTRHCLDGRFPTVSLFKDYQNAAMAILEKSDFTMISGNPFIKKSGWRKISFYFNISYEIKDRIIEFDDNRNVQRAEFVVRAYMQGGRFSDGWGSCDRREKRFLKPNHDIPSTAETRSKNKACQGNNGRNNEKEDVPLNDAMNTAQVNSPCTCSFGSMTFLESENIVLVRTSFNRKYRIGQQLSTLSDFEQIEGAGESRGISRLNSSMDQGALVIFEVISHDLFSRIEKLWFSYMKVNENLSVTSLLPCTTLNFSVTCRANNPIAPLNIVVTVDLGNFMLEQQPVSATIYYSSSRSGHN
ncbi:hypothetical protein NC652_016087 [Populus alba x Populus x berolinensis]|nr:hypothetical protein NC652_016087 [Populus alba x Populus x berolinensis]